MADVEHARLLMKSWDLNSLELGAHRPEILSSGPAARAIVLEIPAGESLQDHQVHESAWVVIVAGEVDVVASGGESLTGGPGLLLEFAPGERHAVTARSSARLLLVLAPWPGEGHPGAMELSEKATVRDRAAEHGS